MDTNDNTTVSPSRKTRRFRWALWWGLGIMVTSLVVIVVSHIVDPSLDNGNDPMMKHFYMLIYRFGIWPAMIYLGLIGPIIEEISFRLWGNGKLWTGVISVVLMMLWSLGVGWWLSIIAALCGVLILTILNEEKEKMLFALMLLSSVLFAAAHWGNYEGHWFLKMMAVVEKLGFGLLASYLVVNHNILWSMGLHIVNNSIVAIPLGLSLSMMGEVATTIENQNFSLEVRAVLVRDDSNSHDDCFMADADTNHYYGSAARFAEKVLLYEAQQKGCPVLDSIDIVADDAYPKFSFTLVYKTQPYDHHGLITDMEHAGLIKIDTVYNEIDKKTVLNIKSTYDPF